ncbi:EamA/RhaT family transporter [Gordonia humi]|uniref:Drug/metabolite transporter (DMT)-like permease n=1 Tax=Gordonia humi TaxID=686429 RepID=A0A840EVA8_9ACTN|nr:EamA/RhaT family transporter [Gordonia humi]MBB4133776.1 drug/metabolite transporter (DMT)-like permease [Gordonia humi]
MFAIGVIAAAMAAVAYGVSTVLRALGARRVAVEMREDGRTGADSAAAPSVGSTMSTIVDPAFILGTLMVIVGFGGGALAARFLPLFLAQSIVAANLVVTALLGTLLLNITLHTRDWVAIWLVVLSLFMLGVSSAPHANDYAERSFHWELFGATIVVAAVALVGVYTFGKYAAVVGGAAAGLLFGIIAVSVRILDGMNPFDLAALLTDPAAYALAVAGAVGFYVQTVALQVGAVNGVTALLVTGETALPSLIGVVFLGDIARPGMEWLAIVGFIGAVIGAVLVAWYSTGDPDHFGEAPPEKGGWRRGREETDDASA